MLIKFSRLDLIDFSKWGFAPDGVIGAVICDEFKMAITGQLESEEGAELEIKRNCKLEISLPFGNTYEGPIAEISFAELVADFIYVVEDDDKEQALAELKAELLKAIQQIEAASS